MIKMHYKFCEPVQYNSVLQTDFLIKVIYDIVKHQ